MKPQQRGFGTGAMTEPEAGAELEDGLLDDPETADPELLDHGRSRDALR